MPKWRTDSSAAACARVRSCRLAGQRRERHVEAEAGQELASTRPRPRAGTPAGDTAGDQQAAGQRRPPARRARTCRPPLPATSSPRRRPRGLDTPATDQQQHERRRRPSAPSTAAPARRRRARRAAGAAGARGPWRSGWPAARGRPLARSAPGRRRSRASRSARSASSSAGPAAVPTTAAPTHSRPSRRRRARRTPRSSAQAPSAWSAATSSSSSELELAQPIEAAANRSAPAPPVARLCSAADTGEARQHRSYTPITAATPSTVVSSSIRSGGRARITTAASASASPTAIAINARFTRSF